MINFSHPFPIISGTVIPMHKNSELLGGISHFSSQNEFIISELFSLGSTNDSPNSIFFIKW